MSNLENWKQLYEYGKKYRDMKPWTKMRNTDFICLRFSDQEECYVSIMGNGEMEYGFMLTYGKEARYEMRKILYCAYDQAASSIISSEANSINMFIVGKDEVPEEQRELMKNLGVSYKGNNWIYFETYEAGYVPFICSDEEVAVLNRYFPKLLEALKIFMKINKADSSETEKLWIYENKNNSWEYRTEDFSIEDFTWKKSIYTNEVQASKLSKKANNGKCWEYGMFCSLDVVADENYKKPFVSKISVCADHFDQVILFPHIWNPKEQAEDIFEELVEYMLEHGKPKKICVGSPYSFAFLEDFCKKTKIHLEINEVPCINSFVGEMMQSKYADDINEEDVAFVKDLMEKSDIDIDELRKMAEKLSPKEFEKQVMPKIFGALADMNFDDEDYDLFGNDEDFDLFGDDESDLDEVYGREEKLMAIHEFFTSKRKDKIVDFDLAMMDIQEVVEEASTEEICTQLEALGTKISSTKNRKSLEKTLVKTLKNEFPYIMNLLSDKERQLLELVYFDSDDFDCEIAFSKFKFDENTVAKLVKWNLIDVAFFDHKRVMILEEIDGLIQY